MKKVVAMLVTVVMCMSISVVAMASGSSADVKAKYIEGIETEVQSVDITWGDMQFDYNEADGTWNTSTHEWDADGNDTWTVASGMSNTIKLANHSSTAVSATLSFAAGSSYSSVGGSFTYNSAALNSAINMVKPTANTDAAEYIVSFIPTGSISDNVSNYTTVGTITVTLQ